MPQPAPFLFPLGAQLGRDNVVLQAQAKRHSVQNYSGPLSIKTVLRGRVAWLVRGQPLVVDRSSFLVLADGEAYSMDIQSPKPVETCCVFFAPGFVEQIAQDLTSPLSGSLDAPDRRAASLPYLSSLHADRDCGVVQRVHTLAPRCKGLLFPSGFEEDFLVLGQSLLTLYTQIQNEVARVPATKQSTKDELYRRLLAGRDYLHSHADQSVSLAAAARAACLSPFHFHRGFTQAFQQTPHDYLTSLRLAEARRQLEMGASVLEACLGVGFSSPSAFTRLFRAKFAEPPSALRRKFARSSKHSA